MNRLDDLRDAGGDPLLEGHVYTGTLPGNWGANDQTPMLVSHGALVLLPALRTGFIIRRPSAAIAEGLRHLRPLSAWGAANTQLGRTRLAVAQRLTPLIGRSEPCTTTTRPRRGHLYTTGPSMDGQLWLSMGTAQDLRRDPSGSPDGLAHVEAPAPTMLELGAVRAVAGGVDVHWGHVLDLLDDPSVDTVGENLHDQRGDVPLVDLGVLLDDAWFADHAVLVDRSGVISFTGTPMSTNEARALMNLCGG